MTYPPRVFPQHDYARDQRLGEEIKGTDLNGDIARICAAIDQLNSFVRGVTTSDGKLNTLNAVRELDVITVQFNSGDGFTGTFPLLQAIDPAVDLVRAWVSGVLTPPLSYTSTTVTFAAAPPAGVNNIEFRIYTNMAGVLDRIQSLVSLLGASYVGYDDNEARYIADNVRDALTEVKRAHDDLVTALGAPEDMLLRDGSRTLTGQWEVNERASVTIPPVAATGSFDLTAQPADADTVTLSDGVTTFTYEFDNNATVAPGNISVTIGATRDATAANLLLAINNSPLAIVATGVSTGPAFNVQLQNEIPRALGNVPILAASAVISAIVGMSGGVDGSFSPALKNHYTLRNLPRSIQDGDVVVHEELADILAQIQAFVDAFLRVDGSNQMVGDLDLGGNQAINMAPGTAPLDGVNKAQLDAVEARIDTDTLAPDGLKDSGVRGTITGPITLGELPTATADSDQTTTPASVTVHTIAGVPRAGAPDHVVNLQQLTETLASVAGASLKSPYALLTTIPRNTVLVGTDGAVVNINAGGTFLATTVTIGAPAVPLRDTFINATGDVSITAAINAPGVVLEISCDGNVTISAAITAKDIRIRAAGTITTTVAGTLTADGNRGVVALDAVSQGMTIAGAITAPLIFTYAVGASVISGTWTAQIGSSGGFQWHTQLGGLTGTYDSMDGGRWGATAGRFGAKTAFYQDTSGAGATPARVVQLVNAVLADYMAAFAGFGGRRGQSTIGNNGFAGGGGGASGGGAGQAGTYDAGVAAPGGIAPQAAAPRPYLLPAAPGGGGGAGQDDVAFGTNPPGVVQGGGQAGGVIVIAVEAALTLTGAVLTTTGVAGAGAAGAGATGGGGGGTVKVSARGTITGGTLSANGGAGPAGAGDGGGGVAFALAPVVAGVVTSATGGTAGQSGALVVPLATLDGWRLAGMLQK
jgi:hypothetical protein